MLLEEQVGRARRGVEEEEHPVPRRQAPVAVPIEPRRHLQHDVPRAREVRALDVDLGLLPRQLEHQRIGKRRRAERQGAEALLHRAHGDAQGNAVAERLERHDAHR